LRIFRHCRFFQESLSVQFLGITRNGLVSGGECRPSGPEERRKAFCRRGLLGGKSFLLTAGADKTFKETLLRRGRRIRATRIRRYCLRRPPMGGGSVHKGRTHARQNEIHRVSFLPGVRLIAQGAMEKSTRMLIIKKRAKERVN
jgi:hypothetical protein